MRLTFHRRAASTKACSSLRVSGSAAASVTASMAGAYASAASVPSCHHRTSGGFTDAKQPPSRRAAQLGSVMVSSSSSSHRSLPFLSRCDQPHWTVRRRAVRHGAGLYGSGAVSVSVSVSCMPPGASEPSSSGSAFSTRRNRRGGGGRRTSKPDSATFAPGGSGPAPSAASSPVSPPSPGGGYSSGGVVAAASTSTATVTVTAATDSPDGSDSDYESMATITTAIGGNHIVPFARRQPRALVLDCAYRPINVLTWYKAFHFDYFGKGEVLEYYPPPAVCTTGSGDFPLPAVLRVPKYTADMQDLCSRVTCTRRNIMVRDGFCCQYCGSRRDLTIDHVHPASKGGKETWDNLVTACMRCNQKKSDRVLRDLGWKLRRQPREPTPFEIGIVAGIATVDILRPPPEWEAYIAPYRERLETYRRAAVEAGLVNLIDDYDG